NKTHENEGKIEKNNVERFVSGIEALIKEGELISLPNNQGKRILMAKTTLDEEKNIFSQLKNQTPLNQKVDPIRLGHYLSQHEDLKPDVSDCLKSVFNDDRFVFVEGKHTKTMLIQPMLEIAKLSK